MVRKLSWLVALLALNCSMGVYALGLGDIELHSALNQPINADIDLLSVRPDDADSIKVLLGSAADFERAGLERPYLLNQLRFLVVAKGKGQYRIHVSSEQAIREPFLNFLIQVTWRGGQLLREYTVLLDPPVLMPAPVQVITAPVTKPAAPAPAPAVAAPAAPAPTPSAAPLPTPAPTPPKPAAPPAPRAAPAPAPAPSAAPSYAGNEYGPIRPNETLWAIANRARPDRSVSVDRMMQAILKANPDAFINNNINNLKAGQILRMPTEDEVSAVSAAQARAATRQQNEEWRNRRTAAAAPAPAEAPAAEAEAAPKPTEKPAAAPEKQAAPQPDAQVKVLVPPRADAAKPADTGTGAAAPSTAVAPATTDIQKELALATEAVETQRQDTEDLRARLTELEQQISTMQKMMTIKDEQLAAMQARSAAADADSQQAGDLLNNPTTLAMLGIFAVVLAALLWLAMRRTQQVGAPAGMPREMRVEPRQSPESAPAAKPAAAGAVTAAAIRAASKGPEPVRAASQPAAVKTVVEALPESDPLSEADIYLAYGRYQQAEDLIKEAMHHDHNPELRLKLLEIFYAAKNATGFEDTARDLLHDVGAGHELWQRVLPMGREICPYSLLFGEEQGGAPASAPQDSASAATAAAVPDSYDFDSGDKDDTVFSRVMETKQASLPDADTGGDIAEDSLDEVGTKLDLARAYIDMGDLDGARSILGEVLQEGSEAQKEEAQKLLQKVTR